MIIRIPTKVFGTLIVTTGIILVLIPYGIFIGYAFPFNLLLWFVIIPALAVWLPLIIRKKRDHLWESVSGLVLFYLIMVWMIYKHYQSEFFAVMMVSAATNVLILMVISLSKKFLRKPA
jgi:hypothetical protein